MHIRNILIIFQSTIFIFKYIISMLNICVCLFIKIDNSSSLAEIASVMFTKPSLEADLYFLSNLSSNLTISFDAVVNVSFQLFSFHIWSFSYNVFKRPLRFKILRMTWVWSGKFYPMSRYIIYYMYSYNFGLK